MMTLLRQPFTKVGMANCYIRGLHQYIERLQNALLTSPCPRPITDESDTVEACIKAGVCGCDNKSALEGVEFSDQTTSEDKANNTKGLAQSGSESRSECCSDSTHLSNGTKNPERPELETLIEEAKNILMSPSEKWDQMVSFVYGNLPEESKATREDVSRQMSEIYGPRPAD